ncbi:uncharacterized protein [Prorops nasuta]|uniref:uncharacterized protein n=1 Tax=Prorops nasuta TaxID=863751 RepID=UPI0034CD03F3
MCDEFKLNTETTQKRRSLVFHSRRSLMRRDGVAAVEKENFQMEESDVTKKKGSNLDKHKETFDLVEYTNTLRIERRKWLRYYKERKSDRKQLEIERAYTIEHGPDFDLNLLSSSQKSFLLAAPNYEHIYKQNKKLLDITIKVSPLSQLIEKQKEQCISNLENRIHETTKTIIKLTP